MSLFNEVFRVRQQIHQLKNKLSKLESMTQKRCTYKDKQEINNIYDQLEHLNIRSHILERISKKCVML
ncbi:MAG: hypothetical protein AB7V50_07135 [Vampirovibrionia bacterium]